MSVVAAVALLGGLIGDAPRSCESLAALALPHVTIVAAVPGGPAASTGDLPAFCRVAATLKPSPDSDIKIEVWLPAENWNGKFQAVGNGAWNGSIASTAMAAALRRGYATASTDTGHTGNTASFALGHPEKLIDFGYRAVHEMTVAAKAIVAAFYGRMASRSYWNGCSAGGRQGLKEAQMFPADYDGIIAGAPGLDWTGRSAQAVRVAQALQKEEARLPPAKLQLLHDAVLRQCDARDGLEDGLIANPAQCAFDPNVLLCRGADAAGCLTAAQVQTARLIYGTVAAPKARREIAGLAPGSELGWTDRGWSASARATGRDHYRFVVFEDPAWDVERFDFGRDVTRIDEARGSALNADDPNLGPFIARGGRLLQYHGWSDPQISPLNSTTYFERVVAALGAARVSDAYRLFMAPGMAHCGGGEGPNEFDRIVVLERWVEKGEPPEAILASHATNGHVDRTRPLCPYPQIARYKGQGSVNDAASFTCSAP